MPLKKVHVPLRYNYIACFLTLDCSLSCSYCINYHNNGNTHKTQILAGRKMAEGLNRLVLPERLPVTLQGGEPSMHPDFIWIINNIEDRIPIDILTNLEFDIDELIKSVPAGRLTRQAPYANIRVSYHPQSMDLRVLCEKVKRLQDHGFSVGVFGVLHPAFEEEMKRAREMCRTMGIDFRTKEFLGNYGGRLYGTYRYAEAVNNAVRRTCRCRTSELIIGPNADVFRCHHDLYKGFPAIGNLLSCDFEIDDDFRMCNQYGDCNPCDVKVKTDRFQVFGHTSVEIEDVSPAIGGGSCQ
ncbi:MAG TPA: radical SAM protein [Candidatus Omnitrophota bacterium]|nr:radical SAM protein [Candidatus Omnitrophota bacterium]